MTQAEEQFLDECPAFARTLGITELRLWHMTQDLLSLGWSERYDKLDQSLELGEISKAERSLLVTVLLAWEHN